MNTIQLQERITETKEAAEKFGYFLLNGFLDSENESMIDTAIIVLTKMITDNEENRKAQQKLFDLYPSLTEKYPKVYA